MPLPGSRARANAIIASAVTLKDVFPQDVAFDMGIEKRAYAVCGRRAPDGSPLEPEIIAVDKHGVLYCVIAPDDPDDPWSVQQHSIPELAGASIMNITAVEQDPQSLQQPRLLIQIAAFDQKRRFLSLTLSRSGNRFERLDLPRSPVGPEFSGEVATTGVASVGAGKLPGMYECFREPQDNGISLNGYAFASDRETVILGLMDNPNGVDHLIAPSLDWSLGICRVEPTQIKIFSANIDPKEIDYRNQILPVYFGKEATKTIKLPTVCDVKDASCVLPVSDTRGLCHGVFIISPVNELVSCSFLSTSRSDMTAVMTGRIGGPKEAREVAYSFGGDDMLHIFVSDEDSQIWYANWALGARPDRLVWQPTGQIGNNIRAPQIIADEPKLFVAGDEHQIEMLMPLPDQDDVWTRTAVVIPSDQQIAVPAVVHSIEIMPVTVQSDPIAGEPIEIYADRDCVVEHGGNLVRLNTHRPFKAQTGVGGGVRLRLPATDISAPQLRIRLPDHPQVPEALFKPEEGLLKKMSGLDPNFQMDASQLKAMGLVPEGMDDEDANQLAHTIREASRQSLLHNSNRPENRLRRGILRGVSAVEEVGVSFSLQSDGTVAMDQGVSRAGRTRRLEASPTEAGYATAESSNETPAGFLGWLRSKWDTVKQFAIKVVNGAVELIVKAGEAIKKLVTAVGRYIEYGLSALLKFINKAHEKAKELGAKIAAYLAEKLEWNDVLRVNKTVKTYLLTSLDDVHYLINSTARGKVNATLANAKSKVAEVFDGLISHLGNQPLVAQSAMASPLRGRVQQNSAMLNIVSSAVPESSQPPRLIDFSPETTAAFEDLHARVKNFGENARLQQLLQQLFDLFSQRTTLVEAATVMLSSILSVARELVLIAIDTATVIANAVLDLVAKLLTVIRDGLEKPLLEMFPGFTFINSFYREASDGVGPSILDLILLVFTAPGTIFFNLIKRKNLLPEADLPQVPCVTPLRKIEDMMSAPEVENGRSPIRNEIDQDVKVWLGVMKVIDFWVDTIWNIISPIFNSFRNYRSLRCMKNIGQLRGSGYFEFLKLVQRNVSALRHILDTCTFLVQCYLTYLQSKRTETLIYIALISIFMAIVLSGVDILVSIASLKVNFVGVEEFKIFLSAGLDTITGLFVLVGNITQLVMWAMTQSDDPSLHEQVEPAASILIGIMLVSRLALPVGALMTNSPEPLTQTLGQGLVVGTFSLDVIMPVAAGLLRLSAEVSKSSDGSR